MKFKIFLFAILFGLSLVSAQSNAPGPSSLEKQIEGLKKVFRYGTYAQQVDALGRFNTSMPVSNREAVLSTLSLLENQLENNEVLRRFMDVIDNLKLVRYYGMYEKTFLSRDGKGDETKPDDLVLMAEALRHMVGLSNAVHLSIFETCFTNDARSRKHPGIQSEALRGIEIHKPLWAREKIKDALKNSEGNEFVLAAAVKALVAYKNEEDIGFLADLAGQSATPSMARWNAIALLGEYAPSEKAYEKLMGFFGQTDVDMRARAIYALGFFKKQDVRGLLERAAKDNSPRIRIFAVRGLSQWNDPESNELLQFKYKSDTEKPVREAAEKILRERGLIKDEKKPN